MQELNDLLKEIAKILNAVESVNDLSVPTYHPIALPQVAFQQLKVKLIAYEKADKKSFNDFQVGENG